MCVCVCVHVCVLGMRMWVFWMRSAGGSQLPGHRAVQPAGGLDRHGDSAGDESQVPVCSRWEEADKHCLSSGAGDSHAPLHMGTAPSISRLSPAALHGTRARCSDGWHLSGDVTGTHGRCTLRCRVPRHRSAAQLPAADKWSSSPSHRALCRFSEWGH